MQSHHHHLDSTTISGGRSSNNNSNNSSTFATMLQSSSGNDPFPSQHGHDFKDFTTLTSVNGGGSEYGNLGGHHNNNNHHHHHAHQHPHNNSNHHHHNNNNNNDTVSSNTNNNNSTQNANQHPAKPAKKPPPANGKKTKGRVKIKMEFIDNKLRRYTTFSKRKTGIMKKAYELSTLTGTQVMLLVASETGHVYTFATRKLQPMITSEAGKALIQTCLNSPDPPNSGSDTQRMSATGYEETELTYAADPNGSDHDVKEDESESMSCSDEEESLNGRDNASSPLIPLTNGLLPPNFAALLAASASGLTPTSLKAGGLSIGLVPAPVSSSSHSLSFTTNSTQQSSSSIQRAQQHHARNELISPVKRPLQKISPQTTASVSPPKRPGTTILSNKSPVKLAKIKREVQK